MFDINTDKELAHGVCDVLKGRLWEKKNDQQKEMLTAESLSAALHELGYDISAESADTAPYRNWYSSVEKLIFVAMRNMKFCIKQEHETVSLMFNNRRCDMYVTARYSLDDVVTFLVDADRDIPAIMGKCKKKLLDAKKKEKMKALSKATVESVVKATLKDTDIQYRLELKEQRAYITLRLNNGLETTVYLSYKTFMQKIPHIVPMVRQLNEMMDALGQPIHIKSTYYQNAGNWVESK